MAKKKNKAPMLNEGGFRDLNRTIILLALGLSTLILSVVMIVWLSKVIAPVKEEVHPATMPVIYPGQLGSQQNAVVNLYFRYSDKGILVKQSREISVVPDEGLEQAVLRELIEGPNSSSSELVRLIPSSAKVIDVESQGDTIYCTFNRELLLQESNEFNSDQMELKMRLMTQSIVNTLIDLGKYSHVQILIDDKGYKMQRMKVEFGFDAKDPNELLGKLNFDESVVLTPESMLDTMMTSVANSDWKNVYDYLASLDESGKKIPSMDTVTGQLKKIGYNINSYGIEGISYGFDASYAVIRLKIEYQDNKGNKYQRDEVPVMIVREGDIWRMTLNALLRILEIPKE